MSRSFRGAAVYGLDQARRSLVEFAWGQANQASGKVIALRPLPAQPTNQTDNAAVSGS